MARITIKGLDEYQDKLNKLSLHAVEVCKYAVYPAASIVIEAVKANTPVSFPDGGDLRDSCSLTEFKQKGDFVYTQIVWTGYDRNGTPNTLKAGTIESGRSGKHKHPFVRPAVDKVRKAAEFAMETALSKKLDQIFK